MSFLDAIILGIFQGLTEFLPVSSSGHLVLVKQILGVTDSGGVSFEVLVHLGTLLSVLVYFRKGIYDLVISLFHKEMREERRTLGLLVICTIPAGVVGVLFERQFVLAFANPILTSAMLIATGGLLMASMLFKKSRNQVRLPSAIVMALGQALAILPGVSRSGTTIVFGMMAGVHPSRAAEFSFLMIIPIIIGATILKIKDLMLISSDLAGPYAVGTLCSFITGLVAVYTVLAVVRRGRFEYFGYYCFAVGLVGLYLFL